MLKSEEIELVHGEVDGTNAPAETAAAKALMEREPEAAALAADLQRMSAMLDQVGDQAPSPQLRAAILASVPVRARAAEGSIALLPRLRAYVQDTARHLHAATPAKKLRLVGMAAVAIVVIVGGSLVDFAPSGAEVGTIGGESMGGVQRASRFRGRTMTDGDVAIGNADLATLLQNPDVVRLLNDESFRNVLGNDKLRNDLNAALQNNELSSIIVPKNLSNDNNNLQAGLQNTQLNSIIVPKNLLNLQAALQNLLSNEVLLKSMQSMLSNEGVRNSMNQVLSNANLSNQLLNNGLANNLNNTMSNGER